MSIEELLKKIDETEEDKKFAPLEEYLGSNGINNIRTKDLDKIIEKYGFDVFNTIGFSIMQFYEIASNKESSKTMNRLTWLIFGFTLITTIATIYNIFYSTLN